MCDNLNMKPTSIAAIFVIAASLAFTAIPGAAHAATVNPGRSYPVADDRNMNRTQHIHARPVSKPFPVRVIRVR